jgi:hypothetical protein
MRIMSVVVTLGTLALAAAGCGQNQLTAPRSAASNPGVYQGAAARAGSV